MSGDHPSAAGLQVERTSLAWARTALAASIAALVVARYGVVRHELLPTVTGLVLLLGAAAVGLGAHRRQAGIGRALAAGRSPVSRTAMRLLTVMVVVTGLASVAAVLTLR